MALLARGGTVAVALIAAVVFAGCSSDEDQPATRTVITIIQQAPVATTDPEPTSAETKEKAAPAEESGSEQQSAPAGRIRVPNVVGKDHQLAQDTMQAAGLYNLAEEDATGQGRLLLFDRNWTVVSQSPAPGTRVAEDRTITLRSKKDGE